MKKILCLFSFIMGLQLQAIAVEIELSRSAIDHDDLIKYNFNSSDFEKFERVFEDSILTFCQRFSSGQEIRIIQTFDPQLNPFYSFSAKPMLSDSVRHALQKSLMKIASINSAYIACSFSYSIVINGGYLKRDETFLPQLEPPRQSRQNEYAVATFEESYTLLIDWIKSGAMPILVEIMSENGVHISGTTSSIERTNVIVQQDANQLIEMQNFDTFYHTHLKNLTATPQLLVAIKAMRLAALGRFDHAQLLTAMLYQFESRNSLIRYLLDELAWRLAYYNRHEGIIVAAVEFETSNERKYALIDSILRINPMSTMALYASINPEINHLVSTYQYADLWERYSTSNPMYVLTRKASSAKEAYQNHLRSISYDLFMDPETIASAHENYAQLALEIESFDFAADLYWMLMNTTKQKQDNEFAMSNPSLTEDQRLANQQTYEFKFKYAQYELGEHSALDKKSIKMFNRYRKELKRIMKKSDVYKNFKL